MYYTQSKREKLLEALERIRQQNQGGGLPIDNINIVNDTYQRSLDNPFQQREVDSGVSGKLFRSITGTPSHTDLSNSITPQPIQDAKATMQTTQDNIKNSVFGGIYGNENVPAQQSTPTNQTTPPQTEQKKGIFDNITEGFWYGTRFGQGQLAYQKYLDEKANDEWTKKNQEFGNAMSAYRELAKTDLSTAGKYMTEQILPMVKANPDIIEEYKKANEEGRLTNTDTGRSLPAEWEYMNPSQRQQYLDRYSRGGREFGSTPWYVGALNGDTQNQQSQSIVPQPQQESTSTDSTLNIAEMAAGIKPKKQNPSPSERQRLSDAEYSREAMKNISGLYDESFVGYPGKELVSKAQGYFGKTTEQQEKFLAATASMRNQVIKQITGAQMSRQEASRIMKQIPSPDDPPIRWKAKYDQTVKNIDMLEQKQLEMMGKGGVETSGYTEGSQPQQSSTPQYKKGDTVERGGKKYRIVGYDKDGEPLVEEIQ